MKYIMLHGLGQSSESWSDTVKVFNDDFEVLCPNLSDWLSGKTPCYDTLYRTLETYCEQFEEPLNICGLSLGGILAMQYAIEHPEKMNSLVLIGTQYEMPKYLLKMQNLITPVFCGSAVNQQALDMLLFNMHKLLPSPQHDARHPWPRMPAASLWSCIVMRRAHRSLCL